MGVKFSQLPVASSVAADDYIAVLDSSESILKRTPISHASSGTEYGLATTTAYGHTKIVDNLSQSSLTSGNALAARQGNVIANDMAVVELSSTAAHAHAVGDFFMLIGQFVKCTVAISVGDTITIGVNCQSTNIGDVLSQLNSKIGNSDFSDYGQSLSAAVMFGNTYSTTEQWTGKYWIDGKKIYCITIVKDNPSSSSSSYYEYEFLTNISASTIIKFYSTIDYGDNSQGCLLSVGGTNNAAVQLSLYPSLSNGKIKIWSRGYGVGSSYAFKKFIVTAFYTK